MSFPWHEIVQQALAEHRTPFYLSAWSPVEAALFDFSQIETSLPLKHWLSFKTHPVAPLVREWQLSGRGIEVVSEYELLAAIQEGFTPPNILANGVGKHTWLSKYELEDLWVHLDSVEETRGLVERAESFDWNVGIRCHVKEEYDPDEPKFSGQFGMTRKEIASSQDLLRKHGIEIKSLHFHLRSNVISADSYRRAFDELRDICADLGIEPIYVGFGGGLPVPGERTVEHPDPFDFALSTLAKVFERIPRTLPSVREIWLENGKFMTARSGVLVVSVMDIKERPECRYLICDGGRTNHAFVSDWEIHDTILLPPRNGPAILTTVCGPTCMAYDRLIRKPLPMDIQIGDHIIWMNAGAYHIPWETRFSHGLAKVLWHGPDERLTVARDKEEFATWWSVWN